MPFAYVLVLAAVDVVYGVLAVTVVARAARRHPNVCAMLYCAAAGVLFGASVLNVVPSEAARSNAAFVMHMFSIGFVGMLVLKVATSSVGEALAFVQAHRLHRQETQPRAPRAPLLMAHTPPDAQQRSDAQRGAAVHAVANAAVFVAASLLEGVVSTLALASAHRVAVKRIVLGASVMTDWAQAIVMVSKVDHACELAARRPRWFRFAAIASWVLVTPAVQLVLTASGMRVQRTATLVAIDSVIAGIYAYIAIVDLLIPQLEEGDGGEGGAGGAGDSVGPPAPPGGGDGDIELVPMRFYLARDRALPQAERATPLAAGTIKILLLYIKTLLFIAAAWITFYVI